MSPDIVLVVLLGGLAATGVVLLVDALTPKEPDRVASAPSSLASGLRASGKRVVAAAVAGLAVLVFTGWVVAALAVGVLVVFWDRIFGGAREERDAVAKVEGLAAWTESLRDTVAGAVGLEQAIPASAYAASPVIQRELLTLADRLRVRMPLPEALQRFAADLDDASADLIIAALILNSRLRGPGLRDVLGSLADSARADLEMRQRVNAGRRSTRRSVKIVVGVTASFVIGLAVFNPAYVAPYGSVVGQVVLTVILLIFSAGVMWLRALARFEMPERFLFFRSTEARS